MTSIKQIIFQVASVRCHGQVDSCEALLVTLFVLYRVCICFAVRWVCNEADKQSKPAMRPPSLTV